MSKSLMYCKEFQEFKGEWARRYANLEAQIAVASKNDDVCREERLGDMLSKMEMNSEYLGCLTCTKDCVNSEGV